MKRAIAGLIIVVFLLAGCLSAAPKGDGVSSGAAPSRIISLAPSNTEILFALGLGDRIVGVTEYDDYPPEAKGKEKIGGFKTVNIEKVVSLEPDLVLATGGVQTEVVENLKGIGVPVVVLDAKNVGDVLENIMLVGRITGREKEAGKLVNDMKRRINPVKKSRHGRPKRTMFIIWGNPLMVAGPDTFANDLIDLAGGENIFSDAVTQYPEVSMESVIERDPEVIISGGHAGLNFTLLKTQAGWSEISAVKNNSLYVINADIVSRPGPRIVTAVEQFSEWIGG